MTSQTIPDVSVLTVRFLQGEGFVEGDVPDGVCELVRDFKTSALLWRASPATIESLLDLPPQLRIGKVRELIQSREAGENVVSGVVNLNIRRGAPTRQPRTDLQPLIDRAKSIVVTIASLEETGDGQMAEITKSVAALQAERDRLVDQFEELDWHLSIGRAVILAHSEPRNVPARR